MSGISFVFNAFNIAKRAIGVVDSVVQQANDCIALVKKLPLKEIGDVGNMLIDVTKKVSKVGTLSGFFGSFIDKANEMYNMVNELKLVDVIGAIMGGPISMALFGLGYLQKMKIMTDALAQISEDEKAFEASIDLLVANANTESEKLKAEMNADIAPMEEEIQAWNQDRIGEVRPELNTPTSFEDIDIEKLTAENPDIVAKGLMTVNSDKAWDPQTQESCTYYAALRRTELGKLLPTNDTMGDWGNAGNWASKALSLGMSVDKKPQIGDVFCSPVGGFGHVGIVEAINGDGSIVVSEASSGYGGKFQVRTVKPDAFSAWSFIH